MTSRTEHSLKNMRVSSLSLIFSVLLNFISRSVFIDHLGTEIVGLSTTLLNILGFLNLAELGLTSAIAGALYKPLYDNCQKQIIDIVSIFEFLYRIIGLVILFLGIGVSFFLPHFFGNTNLPNLYIYGGYYTFLLISLIGYFISYKQTLLAADQKEYIITFYTYAFQGIKFIIQIVALKYFDCGYIVWLIVEFIFGFIYGLIINVIVYKKYPWLITSFNNGKLMCKEYPQVFRVIRQVIPHNIGAFVQSQSSNILIYAFSSLTMVTIYTNYTMLLLRCVYVLNICLRGLTASFGNLVAEGNQEKTLSFFFQFNSLFFIVGGIVCGTCLYQVEPFINLWLGEGYLLDRWIFFLLMYVMYINIIRLPINYFIGGYVLYKDIWAPLVEAMISIVVAIALRNAFGIGAVVIGTVTSLTLIILMWKPYFLFKNGLSYPVKYYWRKCLLYILVLLPIMGIPCFLYRYNLMQPNSSVLGFTFNTIVTILLISLLYVMVLYVIDASTKQIVHRIKAIILNKIRA